MMHRLGSKVSLDILIILALSVFAWAPLMTSAYFFQAHDAPHSIFYLVEFDQTLRDGYPISLSAMAIRCSTSMLRWRFTQPKFFMWLA